MNLFELTINESESERLDVGRGKESQTKIHTATLKDSGKAREKAAKVSEAQSKQEADKIIANAEIHRDLHDHPSITRVEGITHWEENGKHRVGLIMEKGLCNMRDIASGDPKYEAIRKELFEQMTIQEMIKMIFVAIAYFHSKRDSQNNKISHRDVKLENILVVRRERDGKLVLKFTDFDSVKQLEVTEMIHAPTRGVFTDIYKDANLEKKLAEGKTLVVEDYQDGDLFAAALAVFELVFKGKHMFAGGTDTTTVVNIHNDDRTTLIEAKINAFVKNLLFTLTQPNPEDRISAALAVDTPYFCNTDYHIQGLNALNDAILDLGNSKHSDKIKTEINATFFMVLECDWRCFDFVVKELLKGAKYDSSLISFLRYLRNMFAHWAQNTEALEKHFKIEPRKDAANAADVADAAYAADAAEAADAADAANTSADMLARTDAAKVRPASATASLDDSAVVKIDGEALAAAPEQASAKVPPSLSANYLFEKAQKKVPGFPVHFYWIGQNFFPQLTFHHRFPKKCGKAHEDLMQKRKEKIGAQMERLRAEVCPPEKAEGSPSESGIAEVFQESSQQIVKIVMQADCHLKKIKSQRKSLESEEAKLLRTIDQKTKMSRPAEEIAFVTSKLESVREQLQKDETEKWMLDFLEILRDPQKYKECK